MLPKMTPLRSTWPNTYIPLAFLIISFVAQHSAASPKDYNSWADERKHLFGNSLRHIFSIVPLGTGLEIPSHLFYNGHEKSFKRARSINKPRDIGIGSEFLGKRMDPESKRITGSEFLGKRMDPESKRITGSEFLGKRMEPESKRITGSEFLGKRMGSEFLGNRGHSSEILDARNDVEDKGLVSEFLGRKPDSDHNFRSEYREVPGRSGLKKLSEDQEVFSNYIGSNSSERKKRSTKDHYEKPHAKQKI